MLSGIVRLPGMVDVHVHFREPGGTYKEDFETGTQAAAAGGYTQVLDMPNNIPPTIDQSSLNKKIKSAKNRMWCDLGFNFGGVASSTAEFSKIYKKAFGLKVYMNQTTGPLLVENADDREKIFKLWKSTLPVMVHAEGETLKEAINLAKKYKRRLHACHLTANQLEMVEKARSEKLNISCEVCPHHLFLSKKDLSKLGPLGVMKPSLLSESDRKILWQNINKIDMISTDHAPHTLKEKFDLASPKFGVPGLETTIPLFFQAINNGQITLERFVEMTSLAPRKFFMLPRQTNTYILVDSTKSFKISEIKFFTKSNWTPFKNLNGHGLVKKVVIRSKTIFENGEFKGKPRGKVITPNVH